MSTYDQSTVHGWFPRLEYEIWIQPVESNSSKHEAIDSTFPNSDTPFEGYVIYLLHIHRFAGYPLILPYIILVQRKGWDLPKFVDVLFVHLEFPRLLIYDILYTEYPLVIKRVKLGNPRTKWNCSWEKSNTSN